MNAIKGFVGRLHAQGLYAEVSLMWAAPGAQRALDHPPILDQDHSPAAWTAIANAFKDDPNTFFGLQSEPHDISWACWKNGGASCSVGYAALGMQGALDAIRGSGATNVITASGIDWANNLQQWLANKPADPLNQLMAEQHVYGGNTCYTPSCLNTVHGARRRAGAGRVRRVRRNLRRLQLRDDEHGRRWSTGPTRHGVNYEAWTWDTWGDCLSLISDFNGTPNGAYGTWIRNHYLTFPPP